MPLGLEDKSLRNGAMTAFTYHNGYLTPWHGRINHRWSWAPRRSTRNQWLQVYFGTVARLTGMSSQGRQDANQWVKTFVLTFSKDGFKFLKYPKVCSIDVPYQPSICIIHQRKCTKVWKTIEIISKIWKKKEENTQYLIFQRNKELSGVNIFHFDVF